LILSLLNLTPSLCPITVATPLAHGSLPFPGFSTFLNFTQGSSSLEKITPATSTSPNG
jgi:hypothetical protein